MIEQLAGVEVTLERRANEQGHLFGSVTATDIAKALQAQGFNINPDDVNLPGKLDRIDTYKVQHQVRRGPVDRDEGLGRARRREQGRDRRRTPRPAEQEPPPRRRPSRRRIR